MPFWLLLKGVFAPAKILGLLKYWKQILLGGILLTIFYQNFMTLELLKLFGVRTIPGITLEYHKKIDIKEQQLAECEDGRELLKRKIEAVNTEIDKWSKLSSQLQTEHDVLATELAELQRKSQQTVDDILNEPTPETCESAIEFLREAAHAELTW